MKTIFLTSAVGGIKKTEKGKEAEAFNNTEGFVDRLKKYIKKIDNIIFVSSNPDGYAKSDEYFKLFTEAFNIDGFNTKNITILDHRFNGDLEKTIMNADVVFLTGGHTPTQNKYLFEIGLDKLLQKYDGIVIGQSAGSMNLSKTVYAPPDSPQDFTSEYKTTFAGMGLTDIKIMPHMAGAYTDNVDGNGKNTFDYCLEDSYNFPIYGIFDGGFIEISGGIATAYGKTLLIKDGTCKELCGEGEKIEIIGCNKKECNTKEY